MVSAAASASGDRLLLFLRMIFLIAVLGFYGQWIFNCYSVFFLSDSFLQIHHMQRSLGAASTHGTGMASPVPSPAVEGLKDDSFQDLDGSEGWGPRRASSSGQTHDVQDGCLPTKTGDSGRLCGKPFSFYRKRAFKRAVNRARAQGTADYRGRTHSLQELLGQYRSSADQQQPRRQRRTHVAELPGESSFSLSCLSWNCGGLSNIKDELFTWLESVPALLAAPARVGKDSLLQPTHLCTMPSHVEVFLQHSHDAG